MSRHTFDKAVIIAALDGMTQPISMPFLAIQEGLIDLEVSRIDWALKALVYEGEIVRTIHPIHCGECGHLTEKEVRYALPGKEKS